MIYICTEATPSYKLNYKHKIVNNNLCSFSDQYRHLRGMWQIYNYTDLPDEIGIFQKRRIILVHKIPKTLMLLFHIVFGLVPYATNTLHVDQVVMESTLKETLTWLNI